MQNKYTDYDNLLLFSFFYVCCFVMKLCEMTTNISAIVRFVYTKYPVSNTSAGIFCFWIKKKYLKNKIIFTLRYAWLSLHHFLINYKRVLKQKDLGSFSCKKKNWCKFECENEQIKNSWKAFLFFKLARLLFPFYSGYRTWFHIVGGISSNNNKWQLFFHVWKINESFDVDHMTILAFTYIY